jgi:CRISPR-associated endonuclease/helicase Cas3
VNKDSKRTRGNAPTKTAPPLIARTAGRFVRLLDEDIRATAARARNLAAPFDGSPEAHIAALWSDLGKAAGAFQKHVRVPFTGDRVNHSFVGAWYAYRWLPAETRELVALAIAGTHAGIPDLSELPGICTEGATYSNCLQDISPEILEQRVAPRVFSNAAHRELFTRLSFSAHVDADRAEAQAWEAAVLEQPLPTPQHLPLANLHERLLTRPPLHGSKNDELARLRDAFWHMCKQTSTEPPGWYQLSAPSSVIDARSLACYAVGHAVRHGLRQVIMVCATREALEQRVEELHEIFGSSLVVPSAFDHRARGIQTAIEDWDAPVIATTLRDLVGLLFDNRPASCRRLHRIACAMVLVEDAWRLPAPIAPAVVDTLSTLVAHFRSTVTFVSTIPYPIVEGAKEIGMPEAFGRLAPRTATTWPTLYAKAPTPSKLLRTLKPLADCLVVWNSAQALRTFADAAGAADWIYLSSRMCPRDRREVFREALHHKRTTGQALRLATDAVGETLDATFEVVWREMADLPSIAITSQRADAGDHRAAAYRVFPAAALSLEAHVTRLLLGGSLHLTTKTTWDNYDRDLKLSRGRCLWTEDLQHDREQLRFRTIAGKTLRVGGRHPVPAGLALGDANLVPIVVPAPPREGQESVKALVKRLTAQGPDKLLLRQLMDFAVWVAVEERDRYLQQDRARWVADAVVYLRDTKSYDQLGLREDTNTKQKDD